MHLGSDAPPVDAIIELADEISEECPSCAVTASEIVMWADRIRERRPSRDALAAVVNASCAGLSADGRKAIVETIYGMVQGIA